MLTTTAYQSQTGKTAPGMPGIQETSHIMTAPPVAASAATMMAKRLRPTR